MQPTPEPTAPSSSSTFSPRRYDLDWLRVIAILTLLFYHTGMIYVSWGWHIKSAEHSPPMEEVMRWLHRWRMPLLFFISGAGSMDCSVGSTSQKWPGAVRITLCPGSREVRADRDEAYRRWPSSLLARNWAGVWLVSRLKAV